MYSKLGLFADDTRVSKQINSSEDVKLLQCDLDSIIKWSKENNMMLHEDKFDLLVHKHDTMETLSTLPFFSEVSTYQVSSGDWIYPSDSLRDLGLTVSPDLS